MAPKTWARRMISRGGVVGHRASLSVGKRPRKRSMPRKAAFELHLFDLGHDARRDRRYSGSMKDTWFKYLDANVPRYTSYPSALAFTDEIGPAQYAAALGRLPAYEPVSLYLHIPYCRQLCWYCGCNMRVENRPERMAKYVDDLIAEISLVGTTMRGHGRVTQLHFGGGTPNALPGREIERLIDAVENVFGLTDSTPIAMEIDPRLCGDYQAAQLAKLGVTRFSIGVQDFDPKIQEIQVPGFS